MMVLRNAANNKVLSWRDLFVINLFWNTQSQNSHTRFDIENYTAYKSTLPLSV